MLTLVRCCAVLHCAMPYNALSCCTEHRRYLPARLATEVTLIVVRCVVHGACCVGPGPFRKRAPRPVCTSRRRVRHVTHARQGSSGRQLTLAPTQAHCMKPMKEEHNLAHGAFNKGVDQASNRANRGRTITHRSLLNRGPSARSLRACAMGAMPRPVLPNGRTLTDPDAFTAHRDNRLRKLATGWTTTSLNMCATLSRAAPTTPKDTGIIRISLAASPYADRTDPRRASRRDRRGLFGLRAIIWERSTTSR